MQERGEGGLTKAYIRSFGDIITLLKCVQAGMRGEGVIKHFVFLSVHTLWMKPVTMVKPHEQKSKNYFRSMM